MDKYDIKTIETSDSNIQKWLGSGSSLVSVECRSGHFNSLGQTHPFYDCQTYSIANIGPILSLESRTAMYILKKIHGFINKKQLAFNVASDYLEAADRIFKSSDIVFRNQYISTRGSSMTFYLVRTNNIAAFIITPDMEEEYKWIRE
jgi:hypothetical protein